MQELNSPCPFCGLTDIHLIKFKESYTMECESCGAWGPRAYFGNPYEYEESEARNVARDAWNDRNDIPNEKMKR